MKFQNVCLILAAGSFLVACGEATDTTDVSPDPEFGMETLDGKDDSFAIRPGSPEADAVVRFVNRPIADNTAGAAFVAELDARLYSTAAKNIGKYRAGADGNYGTADDVGFDDITTLDGIPFVGRSALMGLFELADAAGFFQRASVDCADFLAHDRYDNYYLTSYADLLEVENSRCSSLKGNLYIEIQGTDLLPPAAREVRTLRHLRTIDGNLQVTATSHWNSIHFEKLETVSGNAVFRSSSDHRHTVEMASLKSAKTIDLTNVDVALFPKLVSNAERIHIRDSDMTGFTGLKEANNLVMTRTGDGDWNVSFPSLEEVVTLQIHGTRGRYSEPTVGFAGKFDALAYARSLDLRDAKYGALEFPKLAEVGSLRSNYAVDPYQGLGKLEEANSLHSTDDRFAAGVHDGPSSLKKVGQIEITTDLDVKGYAKLEEAERNIQVTTTRGVQGFEALSLVGGSVYLNVGSSRQQLDLNGFNAVTYMGSLTIRANGAPVTIGALFSSLEGTESSIAIQNNNGFDRNPELGSLGMVGGGFSIDTLSSVNEMAPKLEIVDGSFQLNYTPETLAGFGKLERIEGSVVLKRQMRQMTGLGNLTAIGGNLSVPRTFDSAALDAFLNRLTEFSGTINYN